MDYICCMETSRQTAAERFKSIREGLGLTQAEFAEKLELKKSTADIERGRTKITGKTVALLLKHYHINPLWLFGESHNKTLDTSQGTAPKIIALDHEEEENILMVPVKASAGYAANVMDVDWYEELPAFNIPLPQYREGSYRAFQVRGDSMLPVLNPGEWVMGKAVESVARANDGRLHVVVTADTVVVKKLKKADRPDKVFLVSLNREYPTIEQAVTEISELWEVNSKLSFNISADEADNSIVSIQQGLKHLQAEIAEMKSGRK